MILKLKINEMKYDRVQEAFRYITPGLYLMALVLMINFDVIKKDDSLDSIAKLSAIIIVLIPFVGFVVGFILESCMTWIERGLYFIRISRPSRKVLHGTSKLYKLNAEYYSAIMNNEVVNDNETANKYQQIAKQVLGNNELVNRYYYQSIMSRHILGAQLFASIYWLGFAGGWSLWHLVYALSAVLLLAIFWYHQNCVYMKYLFAEYAKTIIKEASKN